MWKKIKKCINWIWQLPQNILAIFLKNMLCSNSCYYSKKINEEVEAVVNIIYPNPFSLGNYIFISNNTSFKYQPKNLQPFFGGVGSSPQVIL